MVFSGKNAPTSEKRHAKVLIFKKEQIFSYFFFKDLKYGLFIFIPYKKTSLLFNRFIKRKINFKNGRVLEIG